MRRRALVIVAAVLAGAGILGAEADRAPGGNYWTVYRSDPEVYGKGWTNVHWASGIDRLLVWGGHSHNYRGNNSVRAFDPATDTWEILYPNNGGTAGLTNRDNHISFYVPGRGAKGEFWVIGGAFTTGYPCPDRPGGRCPKGTNFGGRFDLATRRWVTVAHSAAEFGEGLIRDFGARYRHVLAAASAWCDRLNTGVIFGGSGTNIVQIISPNPGGPEPYRFWRGVVPNGPSPRSQLQNNGVCAGEHFYVFGGHMKPRNYDELWRLHVPTRTWRRLASAPAGHYKPTLTYDSRNDVLVLFGGSGTRDLFVYHIATDTWEDLTRTTRRVGDRPRGAAARMGAYSPTANRHLYTGGSVYDDDRTPRPGGGQETDGYTYRDVSPASGDAPRPASRGGASWLARLLGWAEASTAAGPEPAAPAPAARASAASEGPTPAPAPAGSEAGTPASGTAPPGAAATAANERIAIPVNTWVARRLPGRGRSVYLGKHVRLAHNPHDGRIYFLGGDYVGPGGPASGRNEVYSYSVKDDEWRLEWPYCGPAGSVQPAHPDQVGWAYDTARRIFWMVPGYQGKDAGRCAEAGSRLVGGRIMTFDPARRTWAVSDAALPFRTPGNQQFVQYDAASDSLIQFFYLNTAGVATYDIRRNEWRRKRFGVQARLSKEYTALDPERRVIYVVDPVQARLYAYDVARERLTDLGEAPRGNRVSESMLVWDSVNRVLLWPQYRGSSDIHLHVYHPEARRWKLEVQAANQGQLRVRGTNAVFDQGQNVLLVMGGRGDERGNEPLLFLYRYGDGSPRARRPEATPAAPPVGRSGTAGAAG